MEKIEFIAEAKKLGIEDSDIQSKIELYEEFAGKGFPLDFEYLLSTLKELPETSDFLAGTPLNT